MAERFVLTNVGQDARAFLSDRHLGTLTTQSKQSGLQVTPVGFSYDEESQLARVITWAASQKAKNVAADPGGQVALCQVDGGRWLTLTGTATLSSKPAEVADAVGRYAERYRMPADRDDRVVILIRVERIIGRA